jgi:PrcB C-terminal
MGAYVFRCGSRRTSTRRTRTAKRSTCISAIAAAAVVASGCGEGARPVVYRDVSDQLKPAEFTRQIRQIFRSRADLLDYLERSMPGQRIHLPQIDFARREAILVAAGPRSSTGYDLRVLGVRERGDRIVVTVRERTPSLGEPVTPKVTYPFRLLTVPRSEKSLRLKWLGRP